MVHKMVLIPCDQTTFSHSWGGYVYKHNMVWSQCQYKVAMAWQYAPYCSYNLNISVVKHLVASWHAADFEDYKTTVRIFINCMKIFCLKIILFRPYGNVCHVSCCWQWLIYIARVIWIKTADLARPKDCCNGIFYWRWNTNANSSIFSQVMVCQCKII